MSKIISVLLPKGGVGKTTTAVNLAASFAVFEKRTLLIDLDPSGACSQILSYDQSRENGSILDLVNMRRSYSQLIRKTQLDHLDFIPANINTTEDEDTLFKSFRNFSHLKDSAINELGGYDYIILDCPPYLAGTTQLALYLCNSVLIPLKTAQFSISALVKLMNHIAIYQKNVNKRLAVEGILLTMYENNTTASFLTEDRLFRSFGKHVFRTIIPKSTYLAESTYYGQPAVLLNTRAIGSQAYLALAEELIVRNKICPVQELNDTLAVHRISDDLPQFYEMKPNKPNPFRSLTTVQFYVSQYSEVTITVNDIYMKPVETLLRSRLSPGIYEISWTPKNVPAGIYFCKMTAPSFTRNIKMIHVQ
ncbi:MAG: ParA family protein [Ignavibacteriales bacterium]|nr:ParA family protein [Ignavibacteriales bacterium]MCF8438177.1 ParA family protein [Ignavibacteriales bacterium]